MTDQTTEHICEWEEDPDGIWSTACGEVWTFIEAGPQENGVRFCHACGKPVVVVPYVPETETAE